MTSLDIEQPSALIDYLRQSGRIGADEKAHIRKLTGGVSNRTVRVERPSGEAWVLKQALSRLRVEVDWFSSPERIYREAMGLQWLSRLAPPGTITPFIFEDRKHYILAMQAVPHPHDNWKSLLLKGHIDLNHVRKFAHLLGTIHCNACSFAKEISQVFDDRSFFESLRLEPYYAYTARQVPAAAEFLTALIHRTKSRRQTLVHGDYSPKNILIHQNRLILLDHEVIHYGDPAFDLGFSLSHLLSKAHHLAGRRNAFARAAQTYWLEYNQKAAAGKWAEELEENAVFHALGCLLARVSGKSRLEYLDEGARNRQHHVVIQLMHDPPTRVPELIETFVSRV